MGDPANIDIGWRSALMLAAALPVYGCVLFLLLRSVERRASIFLAATLFAAAFLMTPQILGYANFYTVWPGLTYFPFNTKLWIPALFYLHAWCLMHDKPLGWRKYLLVPGLIQTGYYLWAFTALGDYRSKWAYDEAFHVPYIVPIESALVVAGVGLVVFATSKMLRQYRRFLQATQSAASDFEPRWIIRLFWLAGIAALAWLMLEIVDVWLVSLSYNEQYPVLLLMILLVAIAGFDALSSIREDFPKIVALEPAKESPEQRDWKAESQSLHQQVQDEQWYLEPRLTIRDVATRRATNETYVSRTLNKGRGVTFNAFVNGLRVDHARKILSSSEESLIQVAFASGFNSKATFNRVFKDLTGVTPSEYRRSKAN